MPREETKLYKLLAGSLAGATSVMITYPLDIIRARLAYSGLANSHTAAVLHNTSTVSTTECISNWRRFSFGQLGVLPVRRHGIRSILKDLGNLRNVYRGFVPTVLGIIPYAGVSFFTFDYLKKNFRISENAKNTSTSKDALMKFFCGLLAGAAGQTVAYPLDVVRRQMQLHSLTTHLPTYKSFPEAIYHLFKSAGVRGFFTGLSINYLKVAPATAISFVSYEYLKERMDLVND